MITHLSLLAVQIIFAAFPVVAKIALLEVTPWALAWIRLALASLLLLPWFFLVSTDRPTAPDYGRLAVFSLFGVVANQLCYLWGLSLTTAINATVLIGTIPVFTFLIALLLRRETAGVGNVAGVGLAFAGVVVIAAPDAGSLSGAYRTGYGLLLAGAFAYSVYLVLARRIMSRYHPLTVVTWVFTFGSVGMLPFVFGELAETDLAAFSSRTWSAIVFLALFASIAAYFLNGVALKRATSTLVAVYVCTQPVLVAIMAVPILGETITWPVVAASSLIFSGVLLCAAHRPPVLVEG